PYAFPSPFTPPPPTTPSTLSLHDALPISSPALSEGTYTAQATQSDTAGNTGSSAAHTFTVDVTAPTVTLTSPAAGAHTNDSTPTDRKSTRLNSSHLGISYAVFCLKKKTKT